ncbi:MAG: hypothetical protein ACYC66_01400 [Chloroflexota bacterium]
MKAIPLANALTIVVLAVHVLGGLLAAMSPGAYLSLIGSWMFVDFSGLAAGGVLMTLPSILLGIATVAVGSWLFGAALALLYNALAGEREVRA